MWSVLGRHYISLLTPRDFQSIFLVSYHLPQMDVHLFPPHTYHQMHGGYSEVYDNCIKMLLKTSEFQIQIVREKHNLPVIFDSYVSPKVKMMLASVMRSGLCRTQLNAFHFFQENTLHNLQICAPWGITGPKHYSQFCGPCIGASENGNFLHLRRNFSNGIGNWALACIASKRWCVSGIMKSRMATRLFFLP